jgi:hypothetical protein
MCVGVMRETSLINGNTVTRVTNGIPKLWNFSILVFFGGTRRPVELFYVGHIIFCFCEHFFFCEVS